MRCRSFRISAVDTKAVDASTLDNHLHVSPQVQSCCLLASETFLRCFFSDPRVLPGRLSTLGAMPALSIFDVIPKTNKQTAKRHVGLPQRALRHSRGLRIRCISASVSYRRIRFESLRLPKRPFEIARDFRTIYEALLRFVSSDVL